MKYISNTIYPISAIAIVLLFCKSKNSEVNTLISDTNQLYISKKPIEKDQQQSIDTLDYVQGKFDPKGHPLFTLIPAEYASREGMYLRKETMNAFKQMAEAGKKAGLKFKIISATRNFESQKKIWEDKWNGNTLVEDGKNLAKLNWPDDKRALKILEYSSMPSTSRHHWGTDMDINALDNNYFKKGEGKKWYDWMLAHAAEFGFCQPYTAGRPTGYKEERWHWTYIPVSKPLTEYCRINLKAANINGFEGAQVADKIKVVDNYVLGINRACKE